MTNHLTQFNGIFEKGVHIIYINCNEIKSSLLSFEAAADSLYITIFNPVQHKNGYKFYHKQLDPSGTLKIYEVTLEFQCEQQLREFSKKDKMNIENYIIQRLTHYTYEGMTTYKFNVFAISFLILIDLSLVVGSQNGGNHNNINISLMILTIDATETTDPRQKSPNTIF